MYMRFSKLIWLNLDYTGVTDAGLEHLKALKGLTHLILSHTKVTAAGLAALEKLLPNCTIECSTVDSVRRASQWVLLLGGRMTIRVADDERDVAASKDLPANGFQVVGIDLRNNTQVTDAGLSKLKTLTNLISLRLDGQIRHAVLFANLKNGDDVFVFERRRRLGFAQEALAGAAFGDSLGVQHLEGDVAELVLGDPPQPAAKTVRGSFMVKAVEAAGDGPKDFLHHICRIGVLKPRSAGPAINERPIELAQPFPGRRLPRPQALEQTGRGRTGCVGRAVIGPVHGGPKK